jgi:hypothetical protein
MRQCNGRLRARAISAALAMIAAGGLAACGGSSTSTHSTGAPSASATAPSGGGTTAPSGPSSGSTTPSGGTGTTNQGSTSPTPSNVPPIVRASRFVACMNANGVKLPAATKSGAGTASLDFKGLDMHSAKYKRALSTCARKLLGSLHVARGKQHVIPLAGIRLKGLHVGSVHIGHIEVPAIHVPNINSGGVNVPPIHVPTPTPGAGASSSGEPPTQPKNGGEPES